MGAGAERVAAGFDRAGSAPAAAEALESLLVPQSSEAESVTQRHAHSTAG
jgi:hypothetical protein